MIRGGAMVMGLSKVTARYKSLMQSVDTGIAQFGSRFGGKTRGMKKRTLDIGHGKSISPKALKKAAKTTHLTQYGALPYTVRDGTPLVLLIRSRETQRWIIPKGWPKRRSGHKTWPLLRPVTRLELSAM